MMNNETLAYIRKRVFFWLGFLLLVIPALIMLRPFFTTIIISLISVILLKPLYNYFLRTKIVKERRGLAVTLTLLSGFLIVVIPIIVVVRQAVTQLSAVSVIL
jgi:predicted PurR-regulated permease PerM